MAYERINVFGKKAKDFEKHGQDYFPPEVGEDVKYILALSNPSEKWDTWSHCKDFAELVALTIEKYNKYEIDRETEFNFEGLEPIEKDAMEGLVELIRKIEAD